jgi:hypothetical protein
MRQVLEAVRLTRRSSLRKHHPTGSLIERSELYRLEPDLGAVPARDGLATIREDAAS